MRVRAAAAILFACMSLSGCFDMEQNFKFNADRSAEMSLKLAVDASLVALMSQNGNTPFCSQDMFARDQLNAVVTSTTEGSDVVCSIVLTGDMDAIANFTKQTRNASNASIQIETGLVQNGDQYTLSITIPPADSLRGGKEPMAEAMNAMMLARMSGRVISWSVTAPKIVATNGRVSDDNKVASYSRPLADIYTNRETTRFDTTFELAEPGLWDSFMSFFR